MCKLETIAAMLKGMLSLLMALQMRLWLHHALADETTLLMAWKPRQCGAPLQWKEPYQWSMDTIEDIGGCFAALKWK